MRNRLASRSSGTASTYSTFPKRLTAESKCRDRHRLTRALFDASKNGTFSLALPLIRMKYARWLTLRRRTIHTSEEFQ
jgi:hypothetical protein